MLNIKKLDSKWYYVVSELFNKGSSYGILLVLSYFLTSEEYGEITLFNSILTLAVVFVSLNMTRNYIIRIFADQGRGIGKVIETIVSFLVVFNLLSVGVICLLSCFDSLFHVPTILISSGILVAIFMINYDILQGLLVASEKKIVYCVLSILYSIFSVVFALGVYFIFPQTGIFSFIGMKLALAVISCIAATIYFIKRYHIRFHVDWSILKPALIYSLPLILHSVSGFLLNYLDRFMINGMTGLSQTALYSFAHNLAMVMNIVVLAVNQGLLPKFYKLLNEKNYKVIDRIITHNGILLSAFAILYSFLLDNVMFLFPPQYRDLQLVSFMLLFSYILYFGYVIYSNYLYYQKNTIRVFLNTLIAGIANIFMNYFLIQQSGYTGATIATLISYFIMYFLFYRSARKMYGKNVYSLKKMTLLLAGTAAVIIVYYLLKDIIVLKFIYIAVVTAGLLILYWKRRRYVNG